MMLQQGTMQSGLTAVPVGNHVEVKASSTVMAGNHVELVQSNPQSPPGNHVEFDSYTVPTGNHVEFLLSSANQVVFKVSCVFAPGTM